MNILMGLFFFFLQMIVRRGLVLALVMLIASMASAYESQENREESFQRMVMNTFIFLLRERSSEV